MIETNVEVSKAKSTSGLEKALRELRRAKQRVANEKKRKAENHQRWYVRLSGSKFHLHGLLRRALSVLRQPKGETTIPLRKRNL